MSKKKVKNKNTNAGFWKIFISLVTILIFSPLFFALIFYLLFLDKIYPGVMAGNLPLGNKTVEEATLLLSSFEENIPNEVSLLSQDKEWRLSLAEVSFHLRARETANIAYRYGRSGNFINDLLTIVKAFKNGAEIPFDYIIDEKVLVNNIAEIFTEVFSVAIDPKIEMTTNINSGKKMVSVIPGQEGRELDKDKTLLMIKERLGKFDFSPVDLPIHPINPAFGQAQIDKTKERAERLLDKELSLSFEDYLWNLKDSELLDFLAYEGTYSTEKLANYASTISRTIERTPQNAAFNFVDNKVTLFRPAVDGVELDIDRFIEAVTEALQNLEKSEEKIKVSIPVKTKSPEVTTGSVNNLGIKELIGRGYSTFKGSAQERVHNVVLASSKISGALIKPGEVFSFNKTLGDVSGATGFKQAYIIKDGRTVLGDGGGVCQVSSTLFRAALNAGLPIEERWPHSYRVSYYEQGFGPGLDATVFDPSYDLKIKNDTPGHILIQAYTDTNNLKLTFDLYGTSDGRVATISKPKIWSETPPPPDFYQDDPTLPAGTVKQVDWKAWGAKVSVDYKVTRGNEVLQQKTFYSNFSPWRAVFLRGTRP